MSIFRSILDKIMGHPAAAAEPASPASTPAADAASGVSGFDAPGTSVSPAAAPATSSSPAAASAPVDVEAVLTDMASHAGGGGNWQTSIVDLLKLLNLDSSLNARKELGSELGVHAGVDGSAEQNIALHKAVMQKISENGGKVPDSMK